MGGLTEATGHGTPRARMREVFLSNDCDRADHGLLTHHPLAPDSLDGWVRVSWQRSRDARVDADEPRAAFIDGWETDTGFTRASGIVLDSLVKGIENEPVCLILTDAKGTVLDRRGGDPDLLAALDRVDLAPGFRYAESHVGTNGIGTSLEVGGPVLVNGAEHYTGALTRFSCAGALITHPINGTLLGVIDLTTKAENTNALLLSFAKLAARRISERILEEADALERALLGDYYAACRHSGRPVLAIGGDVLMMNALTHQNFGPQDQAAILAQIQEVRGYASQHTLLMDLPSGSTARLSYQPSFAGEALAGGIILVKDQASRLHAAEAIPATLQGVAGDSAMWRRVSSTVLQACSDNLWLSVRGESGVGKAHLLHAAHKQARAGRPLAVHDARDATSTAEFLEAVNNDLEGRSDLVVLHASALDVGGIEGLADLLQVDAADAADTERPWVAITTEDRDNCEHGDALDLRLLPLFARTVVVPPLRHHAEDIPALVRSLLGRARAVNLELSAAAINQLMRLPWLGNIEQLREVLAAVTRTRRSGTAEIDDLPAQCRATTRRNLTRLESLERDAIVEALSLHRGDKAAAATALGISRATIYRKVRDFGIVG